MLFATKLLLAQTTERSLWNDWNPRALQVEKSEYLNGSIYVSYVKASVLKFESRIWAQNWTSGNPYPS